MEYSKAAVENCKFGRIMCFRLEVGRCSEAAFPTFHPAVWFPIFPDFKALKCPSICGYLRPVSYIIFLQRKYNYGKNQRMKGNRWDDHYARRARNENWLARSVYKLQEIDGKFKIMHRGDRLLDLGCYPGSWSQYAVKKVGPEGEVAGVDLLAPERFSAANFKFIQADVLTLDIEWLAGEIGQRDVVISDLAPRTTGAKSVDAARSAALARRAAAIAQALLKKDGNFLCKVFEGEEVKGFRLEISSFFRQVRTFRPSAVRKQSREVYVAALGFGK